MPAVAADALPAVPPDAFYLLDPVPAGPDGELLRCDASVRPVRLPMWAILYRSTGLDGEPIAVSGLVVRARPRRRRPRASRARSWPSPTARRASRTSAPRPAIPIKRRRGHRRGLPGRRMTGWVVVATDYAGLGTPGPHPYLDGPSAGRAVLHSILAAQQLEAGGR